MLKSPPRPPLDRGARYCGQRVSQSDLGRLAHAWHTSLPLGGRWLGVIVMVRGADAVRPCQWVRGLGLSMLTARTGTIIGRATVPHAVAVCDAGALGYSIRHSPGDVCVVAMRAESFVACDAGAGQSPEPPTGTASRRERQCAMSFAPRGEGWAIGRR